MTDPTVREAIASTLAEIASMLEPEHAALAGRVRRARDVAAADPRGELADRDVRLLRRITTGTMGGLSDVAFGAIVNGGWVADEARDQRFHGLSRRLDDQLSRLPPSQPPDLFLVTDRVRQAWLLERDSPAIADRAVEVQPPIWTGPATTSEMVVLRGGAENGADVDVVAEDPASPGAQVGIGHGRVFVTLADAEAAVANR